MKKGHFSSGLQRLSFTFRQQQQQQKHNHHIITQFLNLIQFYNGFVFLDALKCHKMDYLWTWEETLGTGNYCFSLLSERFLRQNSQTCHFIDFQQIQHYVWLFLILTGNKLFNRVRWKCRMFWKSQLRPSSFIVAATMASRKTLVLNSDQYFCWLLWA